MTAAGFVKTHCAILAVLLTLSDVVSVAAQEYLLPPPVPPVAACNAIVNQGTDKAETHDIDISGTVGTVEFQYDTYTQPDRMIVAIDGRQVYDTTCLGTRGLVSQRIPLPAGAQKLRVQVQPNCTGGTGTTWMFKLTCPE